MIVLAEIPDQLIFILVMVVIAAIKALGEKLKGAQGQQEDTHFEDYSDADTIETDYEEYARQLREREAEIIAQQQAPAPPPLPEKKYTPAPKLAPTKKVVKRELSEAEKTALANFEKRQVSPQARKRPASSANARARARRVLASPYAARDAIVLSEILGPPQKHALETTPTQYSQVAWSIYRKEHG